MTMKSSLFAVSMMAIGATFAGSAMASEYSESTSQRIAETNRSATEQHVAGVFVKEPAISDADTLNAMAQPGASTAKAEAPAMVNNVTVGNTASQEYPTLADQRWWKD